MTEAEVTTKLDKEILLPNAGASVRIEQDETGLITLTLTTDILTGAPTTTSVTRVPDEELYAVTQGDTDTVRAQLAELQELYPAVVTMYAGFGITIEAGEEQQVPDAVRDFYALQDTLATQTELTERHYNKGQDIYGVTKLHRLGFTFRQVDNGYELLIAREGVILPTDTYGNPAEQLRITFLPEGAPTVEGSQVLIDLLTNEVNDPRMNTWVETHVLPHLRETIPQPNTLRAQGFVDALNSAVRYMENVTVRRYDTYTIVNFGTRRVIVTQTKAGGDQLILVDMETNRHQIMTIGPDNNIFWGDNQNLTARGRPYDENLFAEVFGTEDDLIPGLSWTVTRDLKRWYQDTTTPLAVARVDYTTEIATQAIPQNFFIPSLEPEVSQALFASVIAINTLMRTVNATAHLEENIDVAEDQSGQSSVQLNLGTVPILIARNNAGFVLTFIDGTDDPGQITIYTRGLNLLGNHTTIPRQINAIREQVPGATGSAIANTLQRIYDNARSTQETGVFQVMGTMPVESTFSDKNDTTEIFMDQSETAKNLVSALVSAADESDDVTMTRDGNEFIFDIARHGRFRVAYRIRVYITQNNNLGVLISRRRGETVTLATEPNDRTQAIIDAHGQFILTGEGVSAPEKVINGLKKWFSQNGLIGLEDWFNETQLQRRTDN